MSLLRHGPRANEPRIAKPRPRVRRIFSGAIAIGQDGAVRLDVTSGCWQVTIDKTGERTSSSRNLRARMWLTVGDRLIVSPADVTIDEVAMVELTRVEQNASTLHGRVIVGALSAVEGGVHVMRATLSG